MNRKLICVLLSVCMLLGTGFSAFAYTPGITTYDLPLGRFAVTDGSASNSGLQLNGGAEATADFSLPFNSVGFTVTYQASADAVLETEYDENTYSTNLPASETQAQVNFTFVQRLGQRPMKLKASSPVTITKIQFLKEDVPMPSGTQYSLPNLTENEKAIQTAVIIDQNGSVLIVNGGRRYVNNENAKETPVTIDGTLCLPTATFARAFGLYYEDMPDKNYVLLRNSNMEFCFRGDTAYKQVNGGANEPIENKVIYQDGRSYLPVRYFAEALGETVGYKDGIVAIDEKDYVDNILNNDTVFSYVNEVLAPARPTDVGGHTYYVAQSEIASDENDGSIARPFRTLAKAGEVAKAGDTVIIREGVYEELFAPKNDGTASNPIIFQAAEGEDVTISATEALGRAAQYDEEKNIWVVPVGWDLGVGKNQLFYNGEAMVEARHPNTSNAYEEDPNREPKLGPLWPTRGDIQVVSENSSKKAVSETVLDQEKDYWKGATFVSLHGSGWALGTGVIDSSDKGWITVTNTTQKWWFEVPGGSFNYGYITNTMKALDVPGEWYYENNMIYFIPPEGVDGASMQLAAKKRQLVVDLADRKYVQLKGINTVGGGMKLNNSEMCMLDGGSYRYLNHYGLTADSRDGFIDDCNSQDPNGAPPRGEMGIYVGGSDNIIINNEINWAAAAGIYLVGKYAYIENNIIGDCGYMGSYVGGLFINTEGWKPLDTPRGGHGIYANTLYNTGRSVINISSAETAWVNLNTSEPPMLPYEIAFNELSNGALCTEDVGIYYVWGVLQGIDRLKTKFHNNLVYNTQTDVNPIHSGIYHDNWTQMQETFDNIVFTENENSDYGNVVYVQQESLFPTSYARVDVWNNMGLGVFPEGKEGLTAKHYPNGKPFQTGAWLNQEPYLVNYNATGSYAGSYNVGDATLGDGVTLENGIAQFSGNDQYIEFKNVDFGEKDNVVTVRFTGDVYNTGDSIMVGFGDSYETATFGTAQVVKATSPYLDGTNEAKFILKKPYGVHNVYIKTKDFKSVGVRSITTSRIEVDESIITQVYGGNLTDFIAGDPAQEPSVRIGVPGDTINPLVNNTWDGTVLIYKDVVVPEDTDIFAYAASSGGQWSGNTFKVRIGSADAEPIAEGLVDGLDFNKYPVKEYKMNETLKAGTYDFYLTWEGEGKSSNLYWFGFKQPQAATPEE